MLAGRIRQRCNRSVESLPVAAESQPQEICLFCIYLEAGVGVIGKAIRLQIQNGDGLLIARLRRSPAIVEQRKVTSVGAERYCGGETIRCLGLARKRIEK